MSQNRFLTRDAWSIFFCTFSIKSFLNLLANTKVYDEYLLLQKAANGSEMAFTELFYHYKDKLYSFLYGLTGSPEMTEDVIQDTFLKLWKNRTGLKEIDNFSGYIFRMVRNQCLTYFKRAAKETLILAQLQKEVPIPGPDPDHDRISLDIRQKLDEVVSQLPTQQKLVYTLSREQGLKYEEIARQLDISPATVKNHMIKALSSIREQLSPYARSSIWVPCFLAIIEAFEK